MLDPHPDPRDSGEREIPRVGDSDAGRCGHGIGPVCGTDCPECYGSWVTARLPPDDLDCDGAGPPRPRRRPGPIPARIPTRTPTTRRPPAADLDGARQPPASRAWFGDDCDARPLGRPRKVDPDDGADAVRPGPDCDDFSIVPVGPDYGILSISGQGPQLTWAEHDLLGNDLPLPWREGLVIEHDTDTGWTSWA